MAVTIRLSRQGAKKQPNYLVVAVDSEKKRDGAYLAKLGQYFQKLQSQKTNSKLTWKPSRHGKLKAPFFHKRLDNSLRSLQNKV